ncbi:MAG TPA: hypothetical protein DEG09_08685 [Marinilabiliaceae bacterium]|nr:hypothetical protein [Marinilabiliaceae bacterium]HBX88673.1 hypothetical protein [Marinilabiliaceae bacterium]
MKAIELKTTTNKEGYLKIDYKLNQSEKDVRIIILLDEDHTDSEEETQWLQNVSNNPVFDFLGEAEEDVYTLKDGEPFYG